jgi:transposase
MPKLRIVHLDSPQKETLEECRNHHPLPHMREKAAALLKVANGARPAHVARSGLLKPHKPDVIYRWIDRYEQQGIAGLFVQPGRGRKPAFSPSRSK